MSVRITDSDDIATARQKSRGSDQEDLTTAQQELLNDMRVSLKQMKRGEILPAREALREIHLELEAEDDANRSDT